MRSAVTLILYLMILTSCSDFGYHEKVSVEDGHKILRRYFFNSKHDTTYIFYNNSSIKEVIIYEYGFLNGISKEYDSLGKLLSATEFENDTVISKISYHINGDIFYEFKSGIFTGYLYDEKQTLTQITYGHPKFTLTYKNIRNPEFLADSAYFYDRDIMIYDFE